jgi:hypothetical protein
MIEAGPSVIFLFIFSIMKEMNVKHKKIHINRTSDSYR